MRSLMFAVLSAAVVGIAPSFADERAGQDEIKARLLNWSKAFNSRDAATVCELFADDIVSDAPGAHDAGKRAICDRLTKVLADRTRELAYTPEISEIIVQGNTAIVRLTWLLKVVKDGKEVVSTERGMDVFRRDEQGTWRIVRFIAFTEGGE